MLYQCVGRSFSSSRNFRCFVVGRFAVLIAIPRLPQSSQIADPERLLRGNGGPPRDLCSTDQGQKRLRPQADVSPCGQGCAGRSADDCAGRSAAGGSARRFRGASTAQRRPPARESEDLEDRTRDPRWPRRGEALATAREATAPRPEAGPREKDPDAFELVAPTGVKLAINGAVSHR